MFDKQKNDSQDFNPNSFIRTMADDLDKGTNNRPAESKQKEVKEEKTTETPKNLPTSPFFEQAVAQKIEAENKPSSEDIVIKQNKKEVEAKKPLPSKETPKKGPGLFKLIVIFIVIIIVLVSSAAAYFYYTTKKAEVVQIKNEQVAPEVETENIEEPVTIGPSIEKFSPENPNFLSINVEKTTPEEITSTLKEAASDVINSEEKKPFEFILTDKNNNKLSFSIFALNAKINFTPSLLNNLKDEFSLFVFQEADKTARLGLILNPKDQKEIADLIIKEEPKMVKDLESLFLGLQYNKDIPMEFKTSQYKNFPVRYLNLSNEIQISIDYAFVNNKLYLGTSKDTLRAMIDKTTKVEAAN